MKSRLEKMARVIINYSTSVKPKDKVLLRGTSPAAEPLIQALYREALQAGAYAFTYIHLRDEDRLVMESTHDIALLEKVNPMLELMYKTFFFYSL